LRRQLISVLDLNVLPDPAYHRACPRPRITEATKEGQTTMHATRTTIGTAIALLCAVGACESAQAKIAGSSDARLDYALIAYERGGDIRVMSDRGASVFDAAIIATPGVQEGSPSWALPEPTCFGLIPEQPPTRTLVYESRAAGQGGDIMLATLTGTPPTLAASVSLTAAAGADDGAPAVGAHNADGGAGQQSIVFTRGPVGQRDLWAMSLDGSHQVRLTSSAADDSNPDWSPDGASVAYETSDANGRQQIAIVDVTFDAAHEQVTGAGAPRIVTSGTESHGDPSWWSRPNDHHVDTNRIVHVATFSGVAYLDFLEQPTTTAGASFAPASVPAPLAVALTGDPGGDVMPSWRPDGDGVVFASDRAQAGNADIYRIALDGSGLVRLTQDPAADLAPDWGPQSNDYCLDQDPYNPRPGTQTRTGHKQTPRPAPTTPGPKRTGPALQVSKLRVSKAGKGASRAVVVRFLLNRPARASLVLLRGKHAVARKRAVSLGAGAATMRLRLARGVRGGTHTLRLQVSADATSRRFDRRLKIRSLGHR
jgi:hypothetical protein